MRALTGLRNERGISQKELSVLLKKPPSYVAKVELCERRLDIIEFCIWINALNFDPIEFLRTHLPGMPNGIPKSSSSAKGPPTPST